MSPGEKDDLAFWELLSHDLALEGDEDNAASEPDVDLRAVVRATALKEIGRGRREGLIEASLQGTRRARSSGQYDELSKSELVALVAARTTQGGGALSVQHREFEHASEHDLRSMLEDADEVEYGEEDGG